MNAVTRVVNDYRHDLEGGLAGCSLAELHAEFSALLPELGDARILVQFDADGVSHGGRCPVTSSPRNLSGSAAGAWMRFGDRRLLEVLALEGCCHRCTPTAIGRGGGIAALFESQLADLRRGLAEAPGSRLRSLYFARLIAKGPNRALRGGSFRTLRDRVLIPGILECQTAQSVLPVGVLGSRGFLLLSAADRHEIVGPHGSVTDVESDLVCSIADRLVYASPDGGLLVLHGQEHVTSPPRRRHGLPVTLTEVLVGDRSRVTALFEVVGSFCDDVRGGEVSCAELASWWESATLLTLS